MRLVSAICAFLLALASLSACKPEAAAPAAPAAEMPAVQAPVAVAAPVGPSTPAPVPASARQTSFEGYGDMKFGSSIEQAKAAWGGELKGIPDSGTDGSCHYLTPKWVSVPSEFAFMMEGGKFVRYDVGTDKETAPGGGKVGMSAVQLKSLYGDALQSAPHKYVQGGQNLSVADRGAQPRKLVFETDAAGRITGWHVGLLPQADYVEGCS